MHKWKFFRVCGLDQVLLRNGEDIARLSELDQKLWTALSCPTKGVRFDHKTLELLDTDGDGRIRVPEILAAIEWLKDRLVSLDVLMEAGDGLRLSAVNESTPEGKDLLANAKRILSNLGKESADAITLADAADTARIFADTRFNGDGIVPEDAADDPAVRQVIGEIIAAFGPEADRSGKPGVSQAKADAFFAAAEAHLAWRNAADAAVLPLGDKTAAAEAALQAVRAKIEDYFTRCRLAAFDARAAGPLSRSDDDFAALAGEDLTDGLASVAAFPLARVEADRALPLTEGVNPAWQAAMSAFRMAAVEPLLGAGCQSLTFAQWREIKAKLAPYEAWAAAKAGQEVEGLGAARLAEIAAGQAKARIAALIAQDASLEAENARINEVEKLLRYKASLVTLLNNFVSMSQLYKPDACAIFRVGTLYMDARASTLCFHVDDAAAHAAQAAAGNCCLAYCRITRPGSGETRTVCAAVTAGFARSLWVGRNGIFYDMEGKDWDAVIVKMVDHAISLKEAFWDPWRKIAAMIGGQVKKMLAGKQDAMLAGAAKKVDGAAAGAAGGEPPKKMEGAALASSVAALGIAIGLIGSAVGGLVSVASGLPLWKVAAGVLAVFLLVSGPSVILTWFKLRARDIAPILNACGWAVNRNLRISLKLGKLFTAEAALPEQAELQLTDPYADDNRARNRIIAVVLLLVLTAGLWLAGLLDSVLPCSMRRCDAPSDPARSACR